MAESHILAGLWTSMTPMSAFMAGMLVGTVAFLTSKVTSSSRRMSGTKDQHLHIEFSGADRAHEQESAEQRVEHEFQEAVEAGQQDLFVRQWRVDEVVVDESLGIS